MPEKNVHLADLLPLMQAQLAAGQTVTFSPRGVSMRPMLRQGVDRVTLTAVTGKLRKYDLPLYRLDNGKFILHRIVGVGDTYTCLGDNTYCYEYGIRQDQLIGVVCAFTRGERNFSVNSRVYRAYCRVWVALFPVRNIIHKCINRLRRYAAWMRK